MTDLNKNTPAELNDEELDQVVGGVSIGDTVICSHGDIAYCSNCGRLLKNYSATITGVRGVLGSLGTAVAISPASLIRRFMADGERREKR